MIRLRLLGTGTARSADAGGGRRGPALPDVPLEVAFVVSGAEPQGRLPWPGLRRPFRRLADMLVTPTITVSIESDVIRVAVFRRRKVVAWGWVARQEQPSGEGHDSADLEEADSSRLRALLKQLRVRRGRAVIALPLYQTMIRRFPIPPPQPALSRPGHNFRGAGEYPLLPGGGRHLVAAPEATGHPRDGGHGCTGSYGTPARRWPRLYLKLRWTPTYVCSGGQAFARRRYIPGELPWDTPPERRTPSLSIPSVPGRPSSSFATGSPKPYAR